MRINKKERERERKREREVERERERETSNIRFNSEVFNVDVWC